MAKIQRLPSLEERVVQLLSLPEGHTADVYEFPTGTHLGKIFTGLPALTTPQEEVPFAHLVSPIGTEELYRDDPAFKMRRQQERLALSSDDDGLPALKDIVDSEGGVM